MSQWLKKVLGGRPMRDEGHAFNDLFSGESVRYMRDQFGRQWLATGAWSMFRVRIER